MQIYSTSFAHQNPQYYTVGEVFHSYVHVSFVEPFAALNSLVTNSRRLVKRQVADDDSIYLRDDWVSWKLALLQPDMTLC